MTVSAPHELLSLFRAGEQLIWADPEACLAWWLEPIPSQTVRYPGYAFIDLLDRQGVTGFRLATEDELLTLMGKLNALVCWPGWFWAQWPYARDGVWRFSLIIGFDANPVIRGDFESHSLRVRAVRPL